MKKKLDSAERSARRTWSTKCSNVIARRTTKNQQLPWTVLTSHTRNSLINNADKSRSLKAKSKNSSSSSYIRTTKSTRTSHNTERLKRTLKKTLDTWSSIITIWERDSIILNTIRTSKSTNSEIRMSIKISLFKIKQRTLKRESLT